MLCETAQEVLIKCLLKPRVARFQESFRGYSVVSQESVNFKNQLGVSWEPVSLRTRLLTPRHFTLHVRNIFLVLVRSYTCVVRVGKYHEIKCRALFCVGIPLGGSYEPFRFNRTSVRSLSRSIQEWDRSLQDPSSRQLGTCQDPFRIQSRDCQHPVRSHLGSSQEPVRIHLGVNL